MSFIKNFLITIAGATGSALGTTAGVVVGAISGAVTGGVVGYCAGETAAKDYAAKKLGATPVAKLVVEQAPKARHSRKAAAPA